MSAPTQSSAWRELSSHRVSMEGVHMRTLFETDPHRFDNFSLRLDDLLFDFSKHRITAETLRLLVDLAV